MPTRALTLVQLAQRPFLPLDGPAERAWSATRPSRRATAHRIGWQLLAAAALAGAVATGTPGDGASERGLLAAIAAASFALGAFLRFTAHVSWRAIDGSISATILLVSGAIAIARPLEAAPLLLLWPLLLSAHLASPARFAGNLALTLLTAAAALGAGAGADASWPVASWALVGATAVGVSLAYRRQRTETARHFGELEERTSRDALTGALTRDAFGRAFTAWVGNGMHRHVESSLLLLDVEGLARIDAEQGHEAGDRALRDLAEVVNDCIRETDAFGRLAGEEFGLLFPATGGHEALVAAERIRSAIARRSVEAGTGITVSIGVTGGHAFSDPWAAAQRALRLAKEAGRNCVVLAETETQAATETRAEAESADADHAERAAA